ncbi:hypothetical protein OPV22_019227 [Ensete ventricosum]|uniref:Uncharacterized protein n=1 Tax=Ensete ventricosum TaxID=4639 RepID=A0AAV8R222_ENSVE|nr:hypothetical protein OPV22_019227 [Ensete ventricosum]
MSSVSPTTTTRNWFSNDQSRLLVDQKQLIGHTVGRSIVNQTTKCSGEHAHTNYIRDGRHIRTTGLNPTTGPQNATATESRNMCLVRKPC